MNLIYLIYFMLLRNFSFEYHNIYYYTKNFNSFITFKVWITICALNSHRSLLMIKNKIMKYPLIKLYFNCKNIIYIIYYYYSQNLTIESFEHERILF